ncbi:hypothetical protein GW590_11130 [Rahnella sp. SAP-1]|uniref:Uncharacterized protein n=1 Tax=Rouxiella aceris TaxID=2703884 RepID=A0A848MGD8_9GAMM|nr:hypothetical protein [Rouxiella aceris]NMP27418.1 hypothetical protein [Rouxiella aceris]
MDISLLNTQKCTSNPYTIADVQSATIDYLHDRLAQSKGTIARMPLPFSSPQGPGIRDESSFPATIQKHPVKLPADTNDRKTFLDYLPAKCGSNSKDDKAFDLALLINKLGKNRSSVSF